MCSSFWETLRAGWAGSEDSYPPEQRTEWAKVGGSKKRDYGRQKFHLGHGEKQVHDVGEQRGNGKKREHWQMERWESRGQKGQEREREKLMRRKTAINSTVK